MSDFAKAALKAFASFVLTAAALGAAPALAQSSDGDRLAPLVASADAAPDQGTPSETVTRLSDWVLASGDNQGMPYVVIDKPAAEVFVFDASGELIGAAPALLGVGVGDDTTPGVGDLALDKIPLDQQTTPAGRFVADLGPAKGMKSVLWVDVDSALSLHPVIHVGKEHRVERLASPSPDDRRITHGCINVPVAFYQDVISTTFSGTKGVVYILPDTKSVEDVFPALEQAKWRHRKHKSHPAETLGDVASLF